MKIFIILILGLVLRLISLDQSLWLDEGITANVVRNYSYWQILKNFSPFDFHPPLYYFLIKFWRGFFGDLEVSLRIPSVIFSLLTGYIIYLIGKEIKNKSLGFWAMIFFIFNPLNVYYSQEARMYMMTTFFTTFSLFFLFKIQNSKFKIYLLLFNIFLVLSFYTFYGSIFLILAVFLYLFYKKEYKLFIFSFLIFFVSFLFITPLLYQQFLNSKASLLRVENWSLILGKANFKNLLLIPIKFSIGRISFYPKWFYYLIAGSWTGFLFFKILNIKNKNAKLLYFLFFIPLFFGFLASFLTPLFQYFRFLYLLPIFCLLLALGLNNRIEKGFIVIGFLIFSCLYLFNSNFHREDWKTLAKSLPKNAKVYMILSSSDPLKYYRKDLRIFSIFDLDKIEDREIILIPYASEIWGVDYKKKLIEKRYLYRKRINFRGVFYEVYKFYKKDI